ncbi:Cti6p [Sugiyamaella lignohabitans]|uniref:Cti6p n=1 Tax=Sugiyamaella lignohabitans TaxID=796027 RepID=A0A167EVC4_9ASCO|nr:Cti6p [Sugiyamaella lignohabitans]ANB14505.1 Cti6p [Sugiyamaella lignohabitans]
MVGKRAGRSRSAQAGEVSDSTSSTPNGDSGNSSRRSRRHASSLLEGDDEMTEENDTSRPHDEDSADNSSSINNNSSSKEKGISSTPTRRRTRKGTEGVADSVLVAEEATLSSTPVKSQVKNEDGDDTIGEDEMKLEYDNDNEKEDEIVHDADVTIEEEGNTTKELMSDEEAEPEADLDPEPEAELKNEPTGKEEQEEEEDDVEEEHIGRRGKREKRERKTKVEPEDDTGAAGDDESHEDTKDSIDPAPRRRGRGRGKRRRKSPNEEDVELDADGDTEMVPAEPELEPDLEDADEAQADGASDDIPEEGEEDAEGEDSSVTRCICGHQELQTHRISKTKHSSIDSGLFIQCDQCQVWQHGFCVGFSSETEVPDVYYCEWCRPDFHLVVVRPWGKTSSYLPHADPNANAAKEDDGSSVSNGNDDEHSSGSRSSRAQRHRKDLNERDGYFDKKEKDEDTSISSIDKTASNGNVAKSVSSPSTRSRRSAAAQGSPTVIRTAHEEAAHRRKTLNSSRDMSYEETLKRVLEESTYDIQPPNASAANDSDSNTTTTTTSTTRRRRNNNSSQALLAAEAAERDRDISSEDQSGSMTSSKRRTRDNTMKPPSRKRAAGGAVNGAGSGAAETGEGSRASSPVSESRTTGSTGKSKRQRTKGSRNQASSEGNSAGASGASTPKKSATRPVERSKPRIPPPRSTMSDMRKRVGAILEFIARTQIDHANEQNERHQLLRDRNSLHQQLTGEPPQTDASSTSDQQPDPTSKFAGLFQLHQSNLDQMDQLTRKLLHWEQLFGRYGERSTH